MILFPFCIHNILSTLPGVHFSFKASLTWMGTAAVPSLLRRVFMKLDWGVPLVTTISSPSCVHSSFVDFPGVNLSFNNSFNPPATVVLLPLLRTVVPRSTSFVKFPYVCYKSPLLIHRVLRGANYKFQRLQTYGCKNSPFVPTSSTIFEASRVGPALPGSVPVFVNSAVGMIYLP